MRLTRAVRKRSDCYRQNPSALATVRAEHAGVVIVLTALRRYQRRCGQRHAARVRRRGYLSFQHGSERRDERRHHRWLQRLAERDPAGESDFHRACERCTGRGCVPYAAAADADDGIIYNNATGALIFNATATPPEAISGSPRLRPISR